MGKFAQAGQDFGVLLFPFAETEAGVKHDPNLIDTGAPGTIGAGVQILCHRDHNVGRGGKFGPSLRRAAHVVNDQARVVFDDYSRKQRIESKTAWIVNDFDAVFERDGGDFGLVGIDRNRNLELAFEALQDGDKPAQLLGRGDAGAAGLSRFGSDVENIGAFGFELDRAGKCKIGIIVLAAIGEGIGSNVEDCDNESAFAEPQFT